MRATVEALDGPAATGAWLHRNRPGSVAGGFRSLALLGILAFVAFCASFAPARLLAPLVARVEGAALTGTTGTVWSGSGQLLYGGQYRGRLGWAFRPTSVLKLFPGIAWTFSGEHMNLRGEMNLTPTRAAISMSGSAAAAAINPWLAAYELNLAGEFDLQDLYVHISDNRPDDTRGTINWSGGQLRYVLSQQPRTVRLPPLIAELSFSDGPEAIVVAEGESTPLLEAQLLDSGFARIGITMLLTRRLNEPWPGGGPDHKVVLAVEEKIL